MRRETSCRTFRSWDASRRGAVIGQREVWRAETKRIECDFSAADGLQSRRARSLQARRRSKLHVAACASTEACRFKLDGCSHAEVAGREDAAAIGP